MTTQDQPAARPTTPAGFIDIHSHMLPGMDDGCATLEQSLTCIKRLMQLGFTDTICTPHINETHFPTNTPAKINRLVQRLQRDIQQAGLNYRIWSGGEILANETILEWLKIHGVPTLANSRCVLVDFWAQEWPEHVIKLFEWLLSENYQPILAHPERAVACYNDPETLDEVMKMGVWLQGNCAGITGKDGDLAQQVTRRLLNENKYTFMALDMHRPDSLEIRLEGMQRIATEYGNAQIDLWMNQNPRKLILGPAS